MNQGSLVEANGDEVLAPYFVRADGSANVEIVQLAAYQRNGDVTATCVHDVERRDIGTVVIGHAGAAAQSLLPAGSGGGIATASLDRDDL